MSLPARQQRVLHRIEHSLHAAEPRLRSMFAIFTKLARDEEMPRLEELQSRLLPFRGWRTRLARPRRGDGRPVAHGRRARSAPGCAIILVPVMLAAPAPAVLVGLSTPSVSRCEPATRRSTPHLR